eukprot:TRINITY_DN7836_c0_g1_i1.p1 TRINITY_DN7836_c0_g1~~TRINITY_DN7836_c0_g1_i1.p1  ORF type:complete len:234 (+),score=41.51 TRINITY_DN7836_c0_g1_i1:90-704(+)
MQDIKTVLAGDGTVGKTCMLISYTENRFPLEYVPTVFDNITTGIYVNSAFINLSLWDTAGQEEYSRLRSLSYPDTDIFLLCFSVTWPESLNNIKIKWIPEIKHYCPDAKYVLIGTKKDLRTDSLPKSDIVSTEQGQSFAKEVGAKGYYECSAFTQEGLKEAFEAAVKIVIDTTGIPNGAIDGNTENGTEQKGGRKRKKKECCLI